MLPPLPKIFPPHDDVENIPDGRGSENLLWEFKSARIIFLHQIFFKAGMLGSVPVEKKCGVKRTCQKA